MKVGDEVVVRDSWFLSPENQTPDDQVRKMWISEIDKANDVVTLRHEVALTMKLSALQELSQ